MAEYIEREALLKHCHDQPGKMISDISISMFPAADVAPVVHGRWIEDGNYQICSNCGAEHAWDEYRASYCEDCGAKMDLEGNNG